MPFIGRPVKSIGAGAGRRESLVEAVGPDADHQVVPGDAAEHVPVQHEGDTAEHLPFAQVRAIADDPADAVGEPFVVRHRRR